MNSSYTVEAQLKATGVSQFQQAFANASDEMGKFQKIGKTMGDVGKKMTKGLTLPIVGMGVAALKVGMDFESGMSRVAATTGASQKDMQTLEEVAREMGSTTKYSAGEAAEGLNILAMSGMDTADMATTLEPVLKLAGAAGLELDEAAGIVTNSLGQFNLEADQATRITDVMAKGASIANTDVSQLGGALEMAGSGANAMGYDVESTTALLARFADEGLVGSEAGTAMNAMFRDMKKASKDGRIELNGQNIEIVDAQGNYREFTDIVKDMNDATADLTPAQRDQANATIFGDTAMKGFLKVTGESIHEVSAYEEQLRNAEGAASDMYETMQDNLQGSIDNLKSAFEEAGISLSKILIPMMEKVVGVIQGLVDGFNSLSDGQKKAIVVIGMVAAAIGPVVWAIGAIATGIAGLPALILLLSGPVGAVIAGVFAVVAVGALLIANWESIKSTIKGVFEAIFPDFDMFKLKIQMIWEQIKESFSAGNFEQVGEQFKYMFSLIFQKFDEAFPVLIEKGLEVVTNIIKGITTKVPELFAKGVEFMVMFVDVLADFIPKLLVMGMKFVVSLLKGIGNKMPEWISMAVDMVVKMAQTIGDNLPKMLAKGVEMLGKLAEGFKNNFPAIVSAAFEMIAKLLGSILENLPKLMATGVELIAKLALGLIKAIPQVLRAMADIARGITGAVKGISLIDAGKAIISGFVNGMKNAWEAGKKFIGGIGTWIKNNKGPISYDRKLLVDAGDAIIGGLNKGLQDSFPDVQRTVSGMAGAIENSLTASPTMDIAGNIARSNAQVQSAVSHEINNGSAKQPAVLNIQLGKRNYRAFVEDISNAQSQNIQFETSYGL